MKVKRLILSFFILLSTVSLSALNDVNIIDIVMLINDNKYTKAKPLAQKLVKQQPDNDAARYYLGQCHWAEGDYEKAMNCFREAINLDPKNDAYYLILYNALSAFKGFEDQTDSLALEMINRFPSKYNTPYTLALLGESEMNNSKDSLAQVHLQQALSIDPDYAPAAFALAELYRTQGNMSAYFITIPTYLTSNYYPTEDKTKYLWEVLRMADGQSWRIYGRRLDALVDTLLVTYPKDSLCIKLAGEWDIYTGRPEAASEHFSTLCREYPDYAAGWIYRFYLTESDEERIAIGEEALLHLTKKEDKISIYNDLASVYYKTGEKAKSYKYFEKALRLNPSDAGVLNNYAYNLSLDRKNLKKAEKMSRKSLEAEPDNASFLDTYGYILYLRKDYENAKVYLKKAIVHGGNNNKDVLYHYALVLEALGEKELADFYMNKSQK